MPLGDVPLGQEPFGAAGPMATLKEGVSPGKYGLVTVKNGDGSFNREFKITAAELATLKASGNGFPPGVTQAEWESGKVLVSGKDFDVGDMMLHPDGTVEMKYEERQVNGRFVEGWGVFSSVEYSGTPPAITVAKSVVDAKTHGLLLGNAIALGDRILSISAGTVETK